MPGARVEGAERGGPPISVIVGVVLVAAALLVLIALSIPLLLQHLNSDSEPPYAVGDCVVQSGSSAQPADCSDPEAYEVVQEVSTVEECPAYPSQHAVRMQELDLVYCLEPIEAGGDTGADEQDQ